MKNKIISVMMMLVLVSSFSLAEEPSTSNTMELPSRTAEGLLPVEPLKTCDVNGDGKIDLTDTIYLVQLMKIDVNGDGVVNFEDALMINEAIQGNTCHKQFWSLLQETPEVGQSEEGQTNGDDTNQRSITERSRVRFLDTASKNERHRFYIDREEYTLNMDWKRTNPFLRFIGWFAESKANFNVYDSEGNVLFNDRVADGYISFGLGEDTVNVKIQEGSNIALKRITCELGDE